MKKEPTKPATTYKLGELSAEAKCLLTRAV